jgi:hypothetical protein
MTTISFKHTECVIQHDPDQPRTTLPPLPDTSNWAYPKPVPCPAKQSDDAKCTITVRFPLPAQPVNPDCQITLFHDSKDFWNIDLGELLLRLGQKVIQGDQCDEWLSMVQVASLCRRYRLKWQGGSTKAFKLEQVAMDYLDKHGDIKGGGVMVEYKTEFNEDKRRGDLFRKFRRLYGDGFCH